MAVSPSVAGTDTGVAVIRQSVHGCLSFPLALTQTLLSLIRQSVRPWLSVSPSVAGTDTDVAVIRLTLMLLSLISLSMAVSPFVTVIRLHFLRCRSFRQRDFCHRPSKESILFKMLISVVGDCDILCSLRCFWKHCCNHLCRVEWVWHCDRVYEACQIVFVPYIYIGRKTPKLLTYHRCRCCRNSHIREGEGGTNRPAWF